MAEKKAERAKSPKMIKGTTSSGLKYQINPEVKNDMRIVMYLTQMTKDDAGVKEKSAAFYDFLSIIFGDQVPSFLNEVAARHGGIADMKSVIAELNEILGNADLKNS